MDIYEIIKKPDVLISTEAMDYTLESRHCQGTCACGRVIYYDTLTTLLEIEDNSGNYVELDNIKSSSYTHLDFDAPSGFIFCLVW